ncbi:MAG: Dabb family protein [Phycisphaerales bacterium]
MRSHTNITLIAIFTLSASLLLLSACSSGARTARLPVPPPANPPANIGHIVFVELNNPDDYFNLLRDADWMLGTIPTVEVYAAGKHLETGRASVRNDYDLAIYLGFKNEQDLNIYVAHSQHVDFVNKWKPRLRALRVYDMLDLPNTRFGVR